MPIDLNLLISQTNAFSGNEKFTVENDRLTSGTHLQGLQKLSVEAHKLENRNAVQAFIQSISADPVYQAFLDDVRAPLDELSLSGSRLTGQVIRRTLTNLNTRLGIQKGQDLEAVGKLPAGSAAAFGRFVGENGIPVKSDADLKVALARYLMEVHFADPANAAELNAVRTVSNVTPEALGLLEEMHGAVLDAKGGILKKAIAFEAGRDDFRVADLKGLYDKHYGDDMRVLSKISPETVSYLKEKGGLTERMALLSGAEKAGLSGAQLDRLAKSFVDFRAVTTPECRRATYTTFVAHEVGAEAAGEAVTQAGLPEAFAAAVGNHPDVTKAAEEALKTLDHWPTPEEATRAVADAAKTFVEANKTYLTELSAMVKTDGEPSMATMVRCLNIMTAGDALVDQLMNPEPLGTETLKTVMKLAQALKSSGYAGGPDPTGVKTDDNLRDALKLLLEKKGISQDQLPHLVSRTYKDLGNLSSDVYSLGYRVSHLENGFGIDDINNYSFLSAEMVDVMKQTATHLINALGSEADDSLYVAGQFMHVKPMNDIADCVRDLARDQGLKVPDRGLDPKSATFQVDLAALIKKNQADLEEKLEEIHGKYGLEGGSVDKLQMLIEDVMQAAREKNVGSDVMAVLEHVDPQTINVDKLRDAVDGALTAYTNGLAKSATYLKPERLEGMALDAVINALVRSDTLERGIDALNLSTLTAPEKSKAALRAIAAKSTVMTPKLAEKIAKETEVRGLTQRFEALRTADSPAEFTDLVRDINQFARVVMAAAEKGSDPKAVIADAIDYVLETADMGEEKSRALLDALKGDAMKDVRAALGWVVGRNDLPVSNRLEAGQVAMLADVLQERVSLKATGKATPSGEVYTKTIADKTALPRESRRFLSQMAKLAPGSITDSDRLFLAARPPISGDDMKLMETEIARITKAMGKDAPYAGFLTGWMASSARTILPALKAAGPKGLSPDELFSYWTEGSIQHPEKLTYANMIETILNAYDRKYRAAVGTAVHDDRIRQLDMREGGLLSVAKMLELASPGGRVTLDDLNYMPELGSLADFSQSTFFGLSTDVGRIKHYEFGIKDAEGQRRVIKPRNAHVSGLVENEEPPQGSVSADSILEAWRDLAVSDRQLQRIGQCFTHGTLNCLTELKNLFPGAEADNLPGSMTAEKDSDGNVTITLSDDGPDPVMHYRMTVRIDPEGHAEITALNMSRASAAE